MEFSSGVMACDTSQAAVASSADRKLCFCFFPCLLGREGSSTTMRTMEPQPRI